MTSGPAAMFGQPATVNGSLSMVPAASSARRIRWMEMTSRVPAGTSEGSGAVAASWLPPAASAVQPVKPGGGHRPGRR